MSEALPARGRLWALFLSVDTALDTAASLGSVPLPDHLPSTLGSLHRRLSGAVALISGRSIASLDALFAPLRLPAAGQRGAELRLRYGGDVMRYPRPSCLGAMRDRLDAFAAKYPGVVIEDRGRSLAAQFGRAPQCRARLQSALRDLVAGHPDVEMMPTREAFEIRPRAVDKRMAVEWFMRTTAFSGRLPIFIGDGVADEAGFDAVRSFAGCAIEVGASARGREMRWIACLDDLGSWLAALDRTSRRRQ